MSCPNCGVETSDPGPFCPVCHTFIGERSPVTAEPVAGTPGRLPEESADSGGDATKALGFGVLAVFILIALIAGGLASRGSSSHGASSHRPSSAQSSFREVTYTELQPGDCLEGPDLGLGTDTAWPAEVTAVPCTHKHLAEIFFSGNIWSQSGAYPGNDAIGNKGYGRCLSAFRAYDGIDQSESAFTIDDSAPNAPAWAAGDRLLICVAYEADPVTTSGVLPVAYSIKGSHR